MQGHLWPSRDLLKVDHWLYSEFLIPKGLGARPRSLHFQKRVETLPSGCFQGLCSETAILGAQNSKANGADSPMRDQDPLSPQTLWRRECCHIETKKETAKARV